MNDEVLTIEEAARFLKVAPDIVSGLLKGDELPGKEIGGQWRTTKRALVSYVDSVPLQGGCCCVPVASGSMAEMAMAGGGNCCDPNGSGCC